MKQVPGRRHEGHEVCGVVAYARRHHAAVLDANGERVGVGKHDVGVGGEHSDVTGLPVLAGMPAAKEAEHVALLVDAHVLGALATEPVGYERLAPALVMRGGGNRRQFGEEADLLLVVVPCVASGVPQQRGVHPCSPVSRGWLNHSHWWTGSKRRRTAS